MARRLNKFPAAAEISGKYPWDEWMNGDIWRVGEKDKICKSFRTMIYQQARKFNLTAKTSQPDGEDGDVIFQFFANSGGGRKKSK